MVESHDEGRAWLAEQLRIRVTRMERKRQADAQTTLRCAKDSGMSKGRECGACGRWIPEGGSIHCGLDHQPVESDLSNSNQDQCEESAARFAVTVALAANEIEVLEQLFLFGPTWDGNIVSKSGRDQLFDLKLASRVEGYSFLTAAGIRLALQNKVDRKKETKQRRDRERLGKLSSIEEIISPTNCQAMAPTVEGLEALLRPEKADGRV